MGRHRVVHTCCIEETVWLDIRLLRAWGLLKVGAVSRSVVNWRARGIDLRPVEVTADLRTISASRITLAWRGIEDLPEVQSISI